MALDKLVDGTQLDTDLAAVADAIRAKSGGSASLVFPAGFVSEIGSIQTGGGEWSTNGIADGSEPRGALLINNNTVIGQNTFFGRGNITSVHIVNVVPRDIGQQAFAYCTGLTTFVAQKVRDWASSIVQGCSALTTIDAEILNKLIIYGFQRCANLSTIIMRRSDSVVPLGGVQCFVSTPFESGGTGGTIYIPKALYDHLGDGSALDYKAATNWSKVDGYGTITWAQIEGSIYETQYADGTPVA